MSFPEPTSTSVTARALLLEGRDRQERDAAIHDDEALVAYEAKWQRKLCRLQRAFPERWRVSGLSDEEVRDTLTLRLIEAVRLALPERLALSRPGKAWGLLVLQQELRALRKSFKLKVAPADCGEVSGWANELNQEEALLASEAERELLLAQQRAEQGLSRPQRKWLAALKLSARSGGFFAASAEPNLSAASRLLGKNRSSAQRAYHELQSRFGRELSRSK